MIVGKELSAGQIQYQIMEQIESLRDSFAISISNVPSPHQYDYSKYTVITGSFELEGRYNEVLKLVHHLENNFENAILASLHFKLKKDMVKNKEKAKRDCTPTFTYLLISNERQPFCSP